MRREVPGSIEEFRRVCEEHLQALAQGARFEFVRSVDRTDDDLRDLLLHLIRVCDSAHYWFSRQRTVSDLVFVAYDRREIEPYTDLLAAFLAHLVGARFTNDLQTLLRTVSEGNKQVSRDALDRAMDAYVFSTEGGWTVTPNPFAALLTGARSSRMIVTPPGLYVRFLQHLAGESGDEEPFRVYTMLIPRVFWEDVLREAYLRNASDVHVEFHPRRRTIRVFLRVDGVLRLVREIPDTGVRHDRLVNYLQVLAKANPGDYTGVQDYRIAWRVGPQSVFDVRVSLLPTQTEEGRRAQVCLRLTHARGSGGKRRFVLEDLGFFPATARKLHRFLLRKHGLILVCGPTGSGKNTTVYALLEHLFREPIKIITIEDPVEHVLEAERASLVQITVNPEAEVTFANALRGVLRHDPDVIFVGEVRDEETAREVLRAAVTGHLVITTVHATSVLEAPMRFTHTLGQPADLVASVLRVVLNQRLVRRVCPRCALRVPLNELADRIPALIARYGEKIYIGRTLYWTHEMWRDFLEDLRRSFRVLPAKMIRVPMGVLFAENGAPTPCPDCRGEGFRGRTVLWDLLSTGALFRRMVASGAYDFSRMDELFKDAGAEGVSGETMSQVGWRLVLEGVVSPCEVERHARLRVDALPPDFFGAKQSGSVNDETWWDAPMLDV
ncbi:GspE/PulE family protein [Thermosulfurimonas sp. F29]|uniref:GspE/PulE family protein n=1 Tax=Thermosulfurimonas sp. F29 TaxID=2867247 RepID=UPI001C83D891|nr:ATPase, T2SS/T4P/T4SS family [Thermosulfurimonas sp. F29]MBX6423398.1 Flp pilus assembly complex ATPase component TadA [Thermosulfurimonas sp. F29]